MLQAIVVAWRKVLYEIAASVSFGMTLVFFSDKLVPVLIWMAPEMMKLYKD